MMKRNTTCFQAPAWGRGPLIGRKTSAMALFLLLVSLGLSAAEGPPLQPWFPKAPPLAKPAGEVILATTVAELYQRPPRT